MITDLKTNFSDCMMACRHCIVLYSFLFRVFFVQFPVTDSVDCGISKNVSMISLFSSKRGKHIDSIS